MKQLICVATLFCCYFSSFGQLTGGFENNAAWYIDDSKIRLEDNERDAKVRANSYLKLDYAYSNFAAGIQIESYEPRALLNYSTKFKGTNLGTYYLKYATKKNNFEAIVGHFYEKFGSGLVFRAWEDRQLGIANSIVGGKIKYKPLSSIELTSFYGKQRNGFATDLNQSTLFGINTNINFSSMLKAKTSSYGIGLSYINRKQAFENIPSTVFLFSERVYYKRKGFQIDLEYVFKSKDALVEFGEINPEFLFDGDALLANISFSKKGFGISANLRRTENFGFFSDRKLSGNAFNEGLLNYIPSLTKQYDYSLTNIYVYQAQPNIGFEPNRNKAGEIGGQIDFFYTFKKGSAIGGKSGLSLVGNTSLWHGLKGRYDAFERKYEAQFLAFGQKYYNDYSLEIRKKINKNWISSVTFLQQYYNSRFVEETVGEVNASTVVFDNQYIFNEDKSFRLELQHQWADANFKNWVSGLIEYNFNPNWAVFNSNLYNYGNKDPLERINYYSLGTSYSKNAFRIQVSYGRQRGGLVCVGGVCRFVPESAGLTFSLNYTF